MYLEGFTAAGDHIQAETVADFLAAERALNEARAKADAPIMPPPQFVTLLDADAPARQVTRIRLGVPPMTRGVYPPAVERTVDTHL